MNPQGFQLNKAVLPVKCHWNHPCLKPIISFEIWRMRLPWAHIHTFSSPNEPQGQFWTNLLQKGGISAAEAWVVRQLQHLPCLRSSAALAFLGFQLFLVNLLVVLAWLFFPLPVVESYFPCNTPTTAQAAARPPPPHALGVRVLQEGLCPGKAKALSALPTGGHCHHSVSGAVLQTRQGSGHPACSGLGGKRGACGTCRAAPWPALSFAALHYMTWGAVKLPCVSVPPSGKHCSLCKVPHVRKC